ncbi:MAG: hypothetical protein JST00_41955 [Deltaproteobacteria bacterium]|nr:hypothetical protein [Deltaproteobacteria bacterium]
MLSRVGLTGRTLGLAIAIVSAMGACRSPQSTAADAAVDAGGTVEALASGSAAAASASASAEPPAIDLTTHADVVVTAPSGPIAAAADGDPKTTWEGPWIAVTLPAAATAEILVVSAPERAPNTRSPLVRITHDGFDLYTTALGGATEQREATIVLPKLPRGGTLRIEALPRDSRVPTLVVGEIEVKGRLEGSRAEARPPHTEIVAARPVRYADVAAFCASIASRSCAASSAPSPLKELLLVDLERPEERGTWRVALWSTKDGLLDIGVRTLEEPQRRPTGNLGTTTMRHRWIERAELRGGEMKVVMRALFTSAFLEPRRRSEAGDASSMFAPKSSYIEHVVSCRTDRCETRFLATAKHDGLPPRADAGRGIAAPAASEWTPLR